MRGSGAGRGAPDEAALGGARMCYRDQSFSRARILMSAPSTCHRAPRRMASTPCCLISRAVARSNFNHPFGPSTDFDLITEADERCAPRAVFGAAASVALGFTVLLPNQSPQPIQPLSA
jgi:hypothetical protein